jgi:integrase
LQDQPIDTFRNASLKSFISSLRETKTLGPKSIVGIVSTVKLIVASATNEEGEKLFVRDWNDDFALVPRISRRKQHRPMATRVQVEKAISDSSECYKVLYALLAGSGLRISETLVLRIGDDGEHSCWNPATSQIEVRSAMWKGREQATKSEAGNRTVDICTMLNNFLKSFTKDRKLAEYLFASRRGGPAHEMTLRRFSLAKLNLGDVSFHSFRRFRITHLRSTATVPEEIIRFWAGHRSGASETDGYSRLTENME